MMDAKKELLNEERHALRVLAGVYGFDFNQPHTIVKYDGAWTTKKLLTAAGLSGNELIVLLYRDGGARCEYDKKHLYMVEIDGNGCDNSRRAIDSGLYSTIIDQPYIKAKYHDARKEPRSYCYIIAQDVKHRRHVLRRNLKERPRDASQRFELVEIHETRDYYGGPDYIKSIDLKETTSNGALVNYKMNHKNIETPLDKSGYIVDFYRQQLISRLNNFKHKKRIAAVKAHNFDNEIKKMREKLAALKIAAIKELKAADDYDTLWNAAATVRKLASLTDSVNTYEKRARESAFRSVDHADDVFKRIIERMEDDEK